jgi:outer membrane protein insertion porin family
MRLPATIAILLSVTTGALAQDVIVKGDERIDAASIRTFFEREPNGRLSDASIDNALKDLYATKFYQDVTIKRTGASIVVTVVEAPVILRVAFEGNKHLTDEQLTAIVESKPRETFLRSTVQQDIRHLLEHYHTAGRKHARIDPQIVDLGEHRVNLVFKIDEGKRTSGSWLQDLGDALHVHSSDN